jgi:hypothetical protein
MSQIIEIKKTLLGGQNSDDTPQLIEDDGYLQLQNGRIAISENGRDLRVENVYGTTLLNSGVLPSGNNQCIGTAVDTARHRLIYFNSNSNGDDGIYAYDVNLNINYIVLLSSNIDVPLNFSKNFRIDRNAKIVGDLLYWCDGTQNQPRKVNIEAGIKTNQPSYVTEVEPYDTPIDYKWLQWVKTPPIYPIFTTKGTDAAYTNNFIQDGNFYFTYRYQFKDYEYSALAMYSELVSPNLYNPLGYRSNPSITNETYNVIGIKIPFEEKISDEVLIVELCVKYGNSGRTEIIKTYNKENAADAAKIVLHNNGTTRLGVNFYNDIQGVVLSDIEANNDQDIVPIYAKTNEIAKNRNYAGDFVSGYDSPVVTSLSIYALSTINANDYSLQKIFKRGSSRKMCVTFYDEFKRKCGSVVSNEIIQIPIIDVTAPNVGNDIVTVELSNTNALAQIPDWAYYYSIDISDDLKYKYFISYFNTSYGLDNNDKGVQYVDRYQDNTYYYVLYDPIGSSGRYTMVYNSNYYGVAISLKDLGIANGGYNYTEGDFVEIVSYSLSTSISVRYTARVLAVDGYFLICSLVNLGDLGLYLDNWDKILTYTIYTPNKQNEDELFYTQGQIYPIDNPTTNTRQFSELRQNFYGDVYIYTSLVRGVFSTWFPSLELVSNNANITTWDKNLGWANKVDLLGQQELKTTITFSDTILQGTRSNNLNKFQPLNRKNVGGSNGNIQKLQLTNKKQEDGEVMLAICTNGVDSIYLGETQLVAASINSSVATSDNVIGTVNALRNNYGTINPESVFEYLGDVYWIDLVNGVAARYSSNGLFPVSDFKLNRFFKSFAKDYMASSKNNIKNINGFYHLPTGIDPFTREVLYTIPALIYSNYATNLPSYSSVPSYATSIINRFDIYDKLGKTMSFDYEAKLWRSNYEYMPEWFEYLDNQNYAFKNGLLYSHNTDKVNYNTFYGTQYPVRLCSSWNIQKIPSAIKDCYGIAIESNVIPDFSVLYASYPNIQITDLTDDDYTDTEGVMYAAWFRDRISPNTEGDVIDKLNFGDEIQSAYPFTMLEFQQYDKLMYINFLNFRFAVSKGQEQLIKG